MVYTDKPAIVGVSETWLTPNIPNSKIIDEDLYTVHREDRKFDVSIKKSKGGGVLLLVDINIKSDHRLELEHTTDLHNEIMIVEVQPLTMSKCVIIVAYILSFPER